MDSKKGLQRIKEIAGEEVYKQIIESLAGSTVYFPETCSRIDKQERNLNLREDYYSGIYDIVALATKYDISISTVYKILQYK